MDTYEYFIKDVDVIIAIINSVAVFFSFGIVLFY